MRSDPEMISYIAHVYHTDAELPVCRHIRMRAYPQAPCQGERRAMRYEA